MIIPNNYKNRGPLFNYNFTKIDRKICQSTDEVSHLVPDGLVFIAVLVERAFFCPALRKPYHFVFIQVKIANGLSRNFIDICILACFAV